MKSPECITMPTGVFIARQQASAIEWFTLMNSTEKLPSFIVSPAFTVRKFGSCGKLNSFKRFSMIFNVSGVP